MIAAEEIHLTLSDSCLADTSVLKDLILCFWGHILYIRNQIPLPLSSITGDVLKKSMSAERQSRSKIHQDLKLLKFDSRYQSMALSIESLLDDMKEQEQEQNQFSQLATVCVIIGPSASTSARETHFLHFSNNCTDSAHSLHDEVQRIQVSSNQRNQCKRHLVRSIISNWNPQAKSPPITNSFLALNIRGSLFTISGIQETNNSVPMINDFNMKEGFKIKLRKKSPPPLHLRISPTSPTYLQQPLPETRGKDFNDAINLDEGDEVSGSTEVPEGNSTSDLIHGHADYWLVLRKGIKGIRSES